MSGAVVVVAAGSTAPTLASSLVSTNARAAPPTGDPADRGRSHRHRRGAGRRTEAGLARVEAGVGELAERMARIEGHLDGRLPGPAAPRRAAP